MSRRGRGDGSLSERKPGVWRLRAYMGADPNTGRPVQAERTFKGNKTAALAELRRFVKEVGEGTVEKRHSRGTVAHLLEAWMEWGEKSRGWAPNTVRNRRSVLATVLPRLGHLSLGKLTAADLDAYYVWCVDDGLDPATVGLHHQILTAALNQAVKWDWIRSNPAGRATPPRVPRKQQIIPTDEEVRTLLVAAEDDPDLGCAVALAATTGLRRGELCGLQWGDIDWEAGMLTVERQRLAIGGGQTGPLKSGEARTVALGALGLAVLARYRVLTIERGHDLGLNEEPSGWLLSHDCGRTALNPDMLARSISALGARTGIRVTTHAFRRFAGTQMVGAGVDVKTASGRLGNTPQVLLKAYAGRITERDMAAAAALEELVLPREKTPPAVTEGV